MRVRLLAVMLLTTLLVWSSQWHWAQTIDEPQHLWAGQRILQQADFSRFDNSKMPVSVLNAAGWLWSQSPGVQGSWFWARVPQVVWLLGVVGLVFAWARRRHGESAALAVAALLAVDPNLIAHAGVVTTDLPCTFGILLAVLAWSRLLEDPNTKSGLLAGAAVGFAQLTKFTAVFLGPILGIVLLGWCVLRRTTSPLRQLPLAVLAGLLTLNIGYGFSGVFTPASDIHWKSDTFQILSDVEVPLPVPRPWIEGVDWVKSDDDDGQGHVYAGGEQSHFGQADHYLKTLPRKWPIPLLGLSLGGLAVMLRRREQVPDLLHELVPPAFFLIWFSLAFNSQVGSRYVLPAVPFLALWAARLPTRWVWAGAGWTLVSTLSWWPWGLSYFNETVVDRSQAWRVVADSDLDWGQTNLLAGDWLDSNPGGAVNPAVPVAGPMLVGASWLTGVMVPRDRFECLRRHHPPTEHLGYALYPYNLSFTDLEACFPVVNITEGEGSYPPGDHLVVASGGGLKRLTIGGVDVAAPQTGLQMRGAIVRASAPFSIDWEASGEASVFIDGERLMD